MTDQDRIHAFAAAALTGILTGMVSNPKFYKGYRPDAVARDAWLVAHKMMECPARSVFPAGMGGSM